MPQATDIILNAAGYMIQPGTPSNPGYKRLQDGYPEGLTQRTSITDFFGGQTRALQLERDKFYNSLNIGPALNGQGVRPWANRTTYSFTAITAFPDKHKRIPTVIIRNRLYFAIGKRLYMRPDTIPTGFLTPQLVKEYPDEITDLTIYGSVGILIAFGSAADLLHRNTTTNAEAVLYANDRAHRIENYNAYAVWSDARTTSFPNVLRMVTGTQVNYRMLSYDIVGMSTIGGDLLIITRQALYRFSGRVQWIMVPNPAYNPANPGTVAPQIPAQEWVGDFQPFYQNGFYTSDKDFTFVSGYGGRTLAWIAGGIHELTPSGDRAGWRSTGLTGRQCFGGCVASGYVIVSIESHNSQNELWAYDGNGWWCIARQPMPPQGTNGTWCWPTDIGNGRDNLAQIIVFTEGTDQVHTYAISPGTNTTTGDFATDYAPTAEFVSPMIDAADRDKIKAWRKIGAVFASPELQGNASSTDGLSVFFDYSIDAGATWTQVSAVGKAGNTMPNNNFDFEVPLSGVTSRFIMLRIRWTGVADWAPILTGVWVEHEALASPARRRKWQIKIHARDQEVDRDGVVLSRTGRQLIDELWTAWETDTPLTFRDIDYDDDPTQRTVRIVGISEAATQPFDHGQWGDSHITLNLVEV